MAYTYFESASPIRHVSVKEEFLYQFDQNVDDQFLNAWSVYTIQEETSFASGEIQDVSVRIVNAIDSVTGQKLGDDFKKILFSDRTHTVYMGSLFYFDDNWWVVTNITKNKTLVASVTIRRCNNVLKWADEKGNVYEEYCVIDYSINNPMDRRSSGDIIIPSSFISIYTQLNSDTRKIKVGQRFLFGNTDHWTSFKVYGGGIQNFLNRQTSDNDSARLLQLFVVTGFVNEDVDDITLGIADYYNRVYTFSASPTSYEGKTGESFQIDPNLKINGMSSDAGISYSSSVSGVASVDGDGIVEILDSGSSIISMWVTENTSASASIMVSSSASAISSYEVRVSPSTGLVYDGDTETFDVYAYYGGVLQPAIFDFTVSGSSVPSTKYTFTIIDDNSFSIANNGMYLNSPLTVAATSGSITKDIEIDLRGAW